MRRLLLLPAILVILVGLVFTLQGVGVLPGSAMSGQRQWAVIGIVMIAVGLVLGWLGMRPRHPRPVA